MSQPRGARRRWWLWVPLGVVLVPPLVLLAALGIYLGFFFPFPKVTLVPVLPPPAVDFPIAMAEIPGGSGRALVGEKTGVIKVFSLAGPPGARGVADLRDRVTAEFWEDGFLSLAFHPTYPAPPHLFVAYTAPTPYRVVVSRFEMEPAGPALRPETERVLLAVAKKQHNHNGGMLAFGPEGYLYVSLGDGVEAANGQDRRTLLGSILRLDVDHPPAGQPYGIPPDNPFAGATDGSRPEIWAYGFRNPWRFSIDAPTGGMYVGDVGDLKMEEVSGVVRGGNYGWPVMEGEQCHDPPQGCRREGLQPPLAAFPRDVIRAIIGGMVYRGKAIPRLRGRYVFGDLFRGVFALTPRPGTVVRAPEPLAFRPRAREPGDTREGPQGWLGRAYDALQESMHGGRGEELHITSLAQDAGGELYVLTIHHGIFRIAPPP